MTACLLYAKIHKNKAENLLHLMLYFSFCTEPPRKGCKQGAFHCTIEVDRAKIYFYNERIF